VHHTECDDKDRAHRKIDTADYVRFQSAQERGTDPAAPSHARSHCRSRPAHRLPGMLLGNCSRVSADLLAACAMGIGRPRPATEQVWVKTPKRHHIPIVGWMRWREFLVQFPSSRDLAIVGLMLLQGLRSQEVLDLNRDDLLLPEKAQLRVRGKAIKTRFLPLAPEAAQCWITICGWSDPLLRQTLCSFLSKRPCSRRPDDTRGLTFTVSPPSADHRSQNC